MCGIIGYLGQEDAYIKIYNGLKLLLNRGYDSAGICTIKTGKNSTLIVNKIASTSEKNAMEVLRIFEKEHEGNTVGIGHTRWATHGAKTSENAHPHLDEKSMFSVVHNGIIDNYSQIKSNLLEKGITFLSQTDTEVIPKLLQHNYEEELRKVREKELIDFEKILLKTIQSFSGTWAILIITTLYPNKIFVCKKGSPIVIGKDKNFALLSSEQLPLSLYFNDYVTIDDDSIIVIEKTNDDILISSVNDKYVDLHKNIIENRIVEDSPLPFKHWMIKEIYEQPLSILRCINLGGRILDDTQVKLGGLELQKKDLNECSHIILLGCGTSLNAAQIGAKLLKKISIFSSVSAIDASEFTVYDIPKEKSVFILFSQSGETKDLHSCLNILKNIDCSTLGIINVVGSLIARECDCGIYLNAGREVAVASTKSFTSQIVAIYLIAVWYAQNHVKCMKLRKDVISDLRMLSKNLLDYLNESRNRNIIRNIAENIFLAQKVFILGKGEFFYVAQEAALKLKEVAYMNAEAFCTGSLKHGPFALIDENTIIILYAFGDNFLKIVNTVEEIVSRKGKIILIKDESVKKDQMDSILNVISYVIEVPTNTYFQSILSIIPLQILSYEIALIKNIDPDYPRNLAKVVTVEG